MLLTIFLIVTGILVSILAASEKITNILPKSVQFIDFLNTIRLPLGISGAIIAIINAFNFWFFDYPLLSWILVFFSSVIIINDYLQKQFNIQDGFIKDILLVCVKYSNYFGLVTFFALVIKTIYLLRGIFISIL